MSFRAVKRVLFKFDSRQKNGFTKCYLRVNIMYISEENLKWRNFWENGTWKEELLVLRKISATFLAAQLLNVFFA